MKCFNGFTGKTVDLPSSSTIQQLRQPGKYWVVSDAQLKRDLQGRSLKDVYRENRAKRGVEAGYVPRWETGDPASDTYRPVSGGGIGQPARSSTGKVLSLRAEYLEWCWQRKHTPHPASLDSDHPQNCHRLKAPKRELQAANEHPYHLALAA